MAQTSIEWTERTWNPIAGCAPVSPGCLHCYAATMSRRLEAMGQAKYRGLTVLRNGVRTFNGKISFDESALTIPLKVKKPAMWFVNSMSDLFHEDVPDYFILKVFTIMAQSLTWAKGDRHTYQVLTKRPDRMADFCRRLSWKWGTRMGGPWRMPETGDRPLNPAPTLRGDGDPTPPPNIWLGTSVEDQQRADERIDVLRRCPAAVKFISAEPLLGPVDLGLRRGEEISWIIVGGESGPGARHCDIAWIRSIVEQCRAAAVPVFVKQLGARAVDSSLKDIWCNGEHHYTRPAGHDMLAEAESRPGYSVSDCDLSRHLRDRKGGDPSEWPEDLRVREFPTPNSPQATRGTRGETR